MTNNMTNKVNEAILRMYLDPPESMILFLVNFLKKRSSSLSL